MKNPKYISRDLETSCQRGNLSPLRALKHPAVFCGIFFVAQPTNAAVIYYKPETRLRLNNFTTAHHDYNIDINGDGVFDLQHDAIGGSAFLRTLGQTEILGLKQPFGGGSWYDSQPYALATGAIIGADSSSLYPQYGDLSGWWSHPSSVPGVASLHVRYDSGTSGFFVGARGFIGIAFLIDEEVHYGWIDLDSYSWMQSEIHGWAYESEPGKPIIAGAIPEPSTTAVVAASLGLLLFRRWRSKNINPRSEQVVPPNGP